MTETSRKKFLVTVAGDTVECLMPRDGQISALSRAILVVEDESLPVNAKLESLVLVEDIFMSLINNGDPAWKTQLKRKLAMGELELLDIVSEVMQKAFATQEDQPTQPAVKRRGRPRKAQSQ